MEQTTCEHCGASLKKFWHRLSPGLVGSLIKFRRAVHQLDRNNLHLYNDLTGENELTVAEQMNWTKLRFHGLVAKSDEEKHWLLTRRGAEFLNGTLAVPKRVRTFRNHVIERDEELIYVKDIVGKLPYFDSKTDMSFDYADENDMEKVKIYRAKKNKKGKMICPECKNKLKIATSVAPGKDKDSVKVTRILKCSNLLCGYEELISPAK